MFKIKKLNLLLLKSYLGPFVLTFFIAIFVLLMQFVWKYIDDLVGKGLEMAILAELLFYAATTFVPLALPLAILLSSLMTFGNFGENYELAAAKSVGVSLRKMMTPLIWLCVFFAGLAFYFSNNILPIANLKMTSTLYDVTNAKPTLNIREGFFYHGIENYVIKVGYKDKDGKSVRNIIIYDHTKERGNTSITIAESGKMQMTEDERYLLVELYNGFSYNELLENREHFNSRPMERYYFDEKHIRFDLSSFAMQRTNEEFFKDHFQMMNISQLNEAKDSLNNVINSRYYFFAEQQFSYWHFLSHADTKKLDSNILKSNLDYESFISNFDNEDQLFIVQNALRSAQNIYEISGFQFLELDNYNRNYRRFNVEYIRKFTLSVACFILFFIGAPLGAIIRKGGLGMPLVIAALIFVFYYIISITGEKFVREGVWNPYIGMWLSSAILLPFGVWLTLKTTSDSPLLDAELYYKYLNKISSFFKKIFKK